MGSYRYYRLDQLANTQIDIGGALPGGTLGQPRSTAPRQQKPSYYVVGLVTNISPNMTNDFHYNYLRNFWEWSTAQAPPQLPGLGGALEIGGESAIEDVLVLTEEPEHIKAFGQDGTIHQGLQPSSTDIAVDRLPLQRSRPAWPVKPGAQPPPPRSPL